MSLDQPAGFVKPQTVTSDAFLGGRLTIAQPANGFRAGLDSVLLGAAVAAGSRTILDLGAGAGTAALVALAHEPERTATLIDADPAMAALAASNLAANGFAGRGKVMLADVTARPALPADHFAAVVANPPYFDAARGTAPAPQRAGARHLEAGDLERWVRVAAGAVAPRGEVVFVHTAAALAELLAAFTARFGAITILPLTPLAGEPASRILVRGIKGSRAPLTLLASRALHGGDGRAFAPEFEAIFRGTACLDW